jgi:transposase
MAKKRLSMRKVREILRQKWAFGRSHREVRDALEVSLGGITAALERAKSAGLDWAGVQSLTDVELDARLHGSGGRDPRRIYPDCAWIHTERKRPGVTLELLHQEYLERHPDGYRYTAFCDHYRRWLKRRRLTMRQVHKAGEKLFVDYAGTKPEIVDPRTGEVIPVELFVAVSGASNYTYAEATRTQQSEDWIASHTRAFAFLGGVTELVIPDQLKSGVTSPCRYEPGVQRVYEEMAHHYGTVVLPARPRKPRDKAKVEVGVQVATRWILARLRNQTFFSLDELNARIRELLVEVNGRTMKTYGASRRELFEQLDRPALHPLPRKRFVYAEWKQAKVNIDYHVVFDHHFYSVPYQLVHEMVEIRSTQKTVEIYCRGKRVASHLRSYRRGGYSTKTEHMPKSHRRHKGWTPSRLLRWAETIGPRTRALVSIILESRPHPEQGYRSCLGILRLSKEYGEARLEAAADRAGHTGGRSYRHVNAILKNGLDSVPLGEPPTPAVPITHDNVRGADYYSSSSSSSSSRREDDA